MEQINKFESEKENEKEKENELFNPLANYAGPKKTAELEADLAEIKAKNEALSAPSQNQNAPLPKTGVSYYDEKLKNGQNISLMDAYIAKNLLGLDLAKINENVNLDANVKRVNVNKINDELNTLKTGIDNTLNAMKAGEKGFGFFYGFNTGLNELTNGLIPLSDANSDLKVHDENVIYALANAMKGSSKLSNQDIINARKAVGAEHRGIGEMYGRYASSFQIQATALGNTIKKAQEMGMRVDPVYIEYYDNLIKAQKFKETHPNNKYNYTKFFNIASGKSKESQNENIKKFKGK